MGPAPDRGRPIRAAGGGGFPRRWGYPASLLVMAIGVIVGVTIVVLGIVEFTRDVDRLRRGVTSGEGVVTALEEGEWFVYDEDGAGFGPLDVRVVRVDDGTEIPTSSVADGPDYDIDGRSGEARVSFQAPTDDRYRVEVGTGVGQVVDFALGRDVGGGRDSAIGRGLLIGGLIFVVGLVWFVVTMIQHARWRVRQGAGDVLSAGREQLRRGSEATDVEVRSAMYERSAARAEATAERAAAQLRARTASTPVAGAVDDEIERARAALAEVRGAGADAVAADDTRAELLGRIDDVLARAQDRVAAGDRLRDVAREEWGAARSDLGEAGARLHRAGDAVTPAPLAPPPPPLPPPPGVRPVGGRPAPAERGSRPAPAERGRKTPPPPPPAPSAPAPRTAPSSAPTAADADALSEHGAAVARTSQRQAAELVERTRSAGRAVVERLGRELDEAGAGLAAEARADAEAVVGEMRAVGDRAAAEAGAVLGGAAAEIAHDARSAADAVNARAREVIDGASAGLRAASDLPPASATSLPDQVDSSVSGGPPSGHDAVPTRGGAGADEVSPSVRPAPAAAAAPPTVPAVRAAPSIAPPPAAVLQRRRATGAAAPTSGAAADPPGPVGSSFGGIAPPPAAQRSIAARPAGRSPGGVVGDRSDATPAENVEANPIGRNLGDGADEPFEVADDVAIPLAASPAIAPPPSGRRPDTTGAG